MIGWVTAWLSLFWWGWLFQPVGQCLPGKPSPPQGIDAIKSVYMTRFIWQCASSPKVLREDASAGGESQ